MTTVPRAGEGLAEGSPDGVEACSLLDTLDSMEEGLWDVSHEVAADSTLEGKLDGAEKVLRRHCRWMQGRF